MQKILELMETPWKPQRHHIYFPVEEKEAEEVQDQTAYWNYYL